MSKISNDSASLYRIGRLSLIIGTAAIFVHIGLNLFFILNHTILDVVPADVPLDTLELILYAAIPVLGLPSIITYIFVVNRYFQTKKIELMKFSVFLYLFSSIAINASLFLGGGWYAGNIIANVGASIILFSLFLHERSKVIDSKQIENSRSSIKLTRNAAKIASVSLIVAIIISAIVPLIINFNDIPEPLIQSASNPSAATPNHQNTFFILPIWEGGGVDVNDDVAQMKYMERILGGAAYTGSEFIKIGRSVSCWYTNNLLPDGSFNNASLIHKLNVSAESNTPILFHMNGGNWGQASSTHPEILAMRQNVSNCQWDQTGYCHPIGYNPGPNDRFWSFWPKSDWEKFRERNIKQALDVIFDWWQSNPDLLVGFSTDSEIHLNYHEFEDENEARTGTAYKSYFDYNNNTIDQYLQWAQSNWTLNAFNTLCDTNFATWDEVDAPRSASVVGQKGNKWWETWTDFRIWHVKEAGKRQCRWINESGFPRDMIWHHQILAEPDDDSARYRRADPLETAINPYCKVGVTRYGWISPEIWHSVGDLALQETNDEIPSWGIFEWNLWHQHEYWAFREMLNCIYQYGGHVICPNEWVNCSINEGLWIPGIPEDDSECNQSEYDSDWCCCLEWDEGECVSWTARHGNPQFIAALQDFVEIGQEYERGTCPDLRVNKFDITIYDTYYTQFEFFNSDGLYISGGLLFLSLVYTFILIGRERTLRIRSTVEDDAFPTSVD